MPRLDGGPLWLDRQRAPECRVVQARDRERHREDVQPGEIAAEQQPALGDDDDEARDSGDRLRKEQEERDDELREVVAEDLGSVKWFREMVEVPRQWTGHRLCLLVVVEAREIAPAPIAADLDQARAEFHAE